MSTGLSSQVRGLVDTILAIICLILFLGALYFALLGPKVSAATPQRFVRVGWDVLDVHTVIDTVRDTKTGTCKAFYRLQGIAVHDFGFVNCDGQPIVLPLPFVMSPIR